MKKRINMEKIILKEDEEFLIYKLGDIVYIAGFGVNEYGFRIKNGGWDKFVSLIRDANNNLGAVMCKSV